MEGGSACYQSKKQSVGQAYGLACGTPLCAPSVKFCAGCWVTLPETTRDMQQSQLTQ
eukprot:m.247920 g.247920  ORF g.247920 m.247920 type:complete len:57 (+) comp15402_c3_seq1:480-650(+)